MEMYRAKYLQKSVLYLCTLTLVSAAIDLHSCRQPLGMNSKEITDAQLSASSTHSEESLSARHSRLGHSDGAGAWCPGNPVSKDHTDEYLEINFLRLTVISMVATQGRDHQETGGKEFSSHFMFTYFRRAEPPNDGWKEYHYKNYYNQTMLLGNTNPSDAVAIAINPPIIAERLRIHPTHPTSTLLYVCMRAEVYGCPYEDHLVSYSMPQGGVHSSVLLADMIYDGDKMDDNLMAGLGQLTDGRYGHHDFNSNVGLGLGRGYEWVGWSREKHPRLEIVFHFDSLRNFSAVTLHVNNQFDRSIAAFETLTAWFGSEVGSYGPRPLVLRGLPSLHQEARNVRLDLRHNVGKYVKCEFEYTSEWILISEVSFESTDVSENYTAPTVLYPYVPNPVSFPISTEKGESGRISSKPKGSPEIIAPPVAVVTATYKPTDNANDTAGESVDTMNPKGRSSSPLIGILVAIIVLLVLFIVIIMLLLWRKRMMKLANSAPNKVEQVRCDLTSVQITNNQRDNIRDNQQENLTYDTALLSSVDGPVYDEPWGQNPFNPLRRALPELPQGSENSGSSSLVYAEPDITKSTGHSRSNILLQHYAATDVVSALNLQGVSGNNIYSVPTASLEKLNNINTPVPEIAFDKLNFKEILGDGQFGQVHLCEIEGLEDLTGNEYECDKGQTTLVAVKMLRKNADKNARSDFQKEVKIMSQLQHDNIVKLIAVSTREEPWCMVVEYMSNGDLNQYLFERELDVEISGASNAHPISVGSLIFLATQVASGMEYLSSMNFVHRDLAARNCLVGNGYSIRIADFGMSRSLYSADYYRIEGKAILPIRWMAWECILYGKFSTASDVWALGITLWEIFSLAKRQPLSELSDQQVIDNSGHYYRNSGCHVVPSKPKHCPTDVYEIMKQCWRRDANLRPTAHFIHDFFQQKTMGYEPAVV